MRAKLTRADLACAVARRLGMSQAAAGSFVAALVELMAEALSCGEDLRLRGFGSLRVRLRAARTGRHPRTGAQLQVPARLGVTFRPAAAQPPAG